MNYWDTLHNMPLYKKNMEESRLKLEELKRQLDDQEQERTERLTVWFNEQIKDLKPGKECGYQSKTVNPTRR